MGFGDPDLVSVARDILTKQAHLRLEECVADVHVWPREHASNLLKILPQKSVATPNEGLEGHLLASKRDCAVKENALTSLCHLFEQIVLSHIFTQKYLLQTSEVNIWCFGSWHETASLIQVVSGKEAVNTIRTQLKDSISVAGVWKLFRHVEWVHVHLHVTKD